MSADQRNALSAAAVLNPDGTITKGKTTFADLNDFQTNADKDTRDDFVEAFRKIQSDAKSRSAKLLTDPNEPPQLKAQTILMTAVKDDVTTGARQQDIYSKATNAGFIPERDSKGNVIRYTIVFDDKTYIYDAGLGLLNIEPVLDK